MDDLTTLLGAMPPAEHDARKRIRTARNAAAYNVTRTDSPDALTLWWMIADCATAWIYRPADTATLGKVVEYLRGLLICARRVQELEALS
ncbi:MAG: hypothetical protein KGL48_14020 [Sphingomonadales bacterium]|nr:hypothetical protein [Sphingomonadales bacterium]